MWLKESSIFLTPTYFYGPVPSLAASWSAYILSPDVMALTLCALISEKGLRTKQEGASGEPSLQGGLFCLPCRPAGCDSVMDYHTAINLSAHLVCSYCYAGINKQTSHKCPVSTITRGAESDGAECLYTPGTLRRKPSLATSHTINPTRNGFSVNAGKQVLHKTAVFLIQQKGPVQTLAAVQIVTADTACFVPLGFFFSSLSFLSAPLSEIHY